MKQLGAKDAKFVDHFESRRWRAAVDQGVKPLRMDDKDEGSANAMGDGGNGDRARVVVLGRGDGGEDITKWGSSIGDRPVVPWRGGELAANRFEVVARTG